ncbi:MAG: pyridoxamine 5'-phosphate oxidase family protein [Thermoleophilia bacterium]|nr:pyridoxamine 5'-phosphate oxidase family protein [Thermoleophilia bacterium]
MPKRALEAAPAELLRVLDGRGLGGKAGQAFELLTLSADGRPNTALLSVGEVLAVSGTELRLALWRGTRTAEALARDGRATLACVVPPSIYAVRLTGATPLACPDESLAFFACRIEAVEVDAVDYAELTSGIRFTLADGAAVVERWRRTIDALRAAS